MNDKYVVIHFNEDGDPPSVDEMTGDDLKEKLKEDYWGSRPKFAQPGKRVDGSFVGLVVIKGEIIVPKAVQVATEYDL